jgi:predicted transcriptional regulator
VTLSGGYFYFDPAGEGTAVFLGPFEAKLMDLAWANGHLTVKKALFFLGREDRRAYTTVMTVLNRLVDKGLLGRRKEGRLFAYEPTGDRESFLRERIATVRGCLQRNFARPR